MFPGKFCRARRLCLPHAAPVDGMSEDRAIRPYGGIGSFLRVVSGMPPYKWGSGSEQTAKK